MQSHGRNKLGGATMVSAKDSFLAAVNWFLRKNGHGARLFFLLFVGNFVLTRLLVVK